MVIVDKQEAIRRPVVRVGTVVTKLVDDRRRFLSFYYSFLVILFLVGVALCVWAGCVDGDPMVAAVLYFGFVGGIMGYLTLRLVARSSACWLYPEERLIQVRRTLFGLCVRRRWIDLAHADLVVKPARIRVNRLTGNPLAWLVFLAMLPLGVLGMLIGLEMEKLRLGDASALCVVTPQKGVVLICVVAGTGDVLDPLLRMFDPIS